jgi:DNA processing protein
MPASSDRVIRGLELPFVFRELTRPCRALHVRGRLPDEASARVAIVGARSASPSGRRAAYEIAYGLARAGVTVVSGLARGIDAAAHQGALDANGITVAFLGSGLDVLYPRSSRMLAEAIPERGALVSEYPPGSPPLPYQFVERNRLIAAYTRGTLVVEAGARSGALITVAFALESGRDVWAVPGDPGRLSTLGSNRLLRDGAGCALEAADLIAALGLGGFPREGEPGSGSEEIPPAPPGLSHAEDRVWRALREAGTAGPELLSRLTSLPVAQLLEALSFLELGGHIRREGDGFSPVLVRGES